MTTTLEPPAPTTVPERRPRTPIGRGYGRLWALVPRQLGYLALTALIGLAVAGVLSGLNGGSGTAVVVGLLVLLAVALLARPWAAFERLRLRWARSPHLGAPPARTPGRGLLLRLGDAVADPHAWLAGLHLFLFPVAAAITGFVAGAWLLASLTLTTFPLWGLIVVVPEGARPAPVGSMAQGGVLDARGSSLVHLIHWVLTGRDDSQNELLMVVGIAALGLLFTALLPLVLRGAVLADWGLARLLLSRLPSDEQRERAEAATAAQRAAIAAEDRALRRLERDIHDGPQQRLLRLQMELAAAERRLEPGAAAESVATARTLAAETLAELRALAQGFAPPLLQDRGLGAALGALGRRGEVPVTTAIAVGGAVPEAVERSVYFVAAELVANAVKHSGATQVRLDARTEAGTLLLEVADDGRGGASLLPGHGLAGLTERVEGLGGTLAVDSPAGGPTSVTARVPLP